MWTAVCFPLILIVFVKEENNELMKLIQLKVEWLNEIQTHMTWKENDLFVYNH